MNLFNVHNHPEASQFQGADSIHGSDIRGADSLGESAYMVRKENDQIRIKKYDPKAPEAERQSEYNFEEKRFVPTGERVRNELRGTDKPENYILPEAEAAPDHVKPKHQDNEAKRNKNFKQTK